MASPQFIGARAEALNVKPRNNTPEILGALNRVESNKKAAKKEDEDFQAKIDEFVYVDPTKIHPKLYGEVKSQANQLLADIMKVKEDSPYNWKTQALNKTRDFTSKYQSIYLPSSQAMFGVQEMAKKGFPVPNSAVNWLSNGSSADLDFSDPAWSEFGIKYEPTTRSFQAFPQAKTGDVSKMLKDKLFPPGTYRNDAITGNGVPAQMVNTRRVGDKSISDYTWAMPEQNFPSLVETALTDSELFPQLKAEWAKQVADNDPNYDWNNIQKKAEDLAAYTEKRIRADEIKYRPYQRIDDNPPAAPSGVPAATTTPSVQPGGTTAAKFEGGKAKEGTSRFNTKKRLAMGSATGGLTTLQIPGVGFNMNTLSKLEGGSVQVTDPSLGVGPVANRDYTIKMKLQDGTEIVAYEIKKGQPIPNDIEVKYDNRTVKDGKTVVNEESFIVDPMKYIPSNYYSDEPVVIGTSGGNEIITPLEDVYTDVVNAYSTGVPQQQRYVAEIKNFMNARGGGFVEKPANNTGGVKPPKAKPEFETRFDKPELNIKNSDGTISTHRMASGEVDGKFIAYPTIVNKGGKLVQLDDRAALDYAMSTGEYKQFKTDQEARSYAEGGYKKGTKLEKGGSSGGGRKKWNPVTKKMEPY